MNLDKEPIFKELDIKKLQFWNENPRIMNWLVKQNEKFGSVTSKQIYQYFVEGDGKIKYEIETLAKGLMNKSSFEDLLVNDRGAGDYIVFEGNRRLAAINFLLSNYYIKKKIDPPKSHVFIKCKVYDDITDEDMFNLVELIHGEGKKKGHTAYNRALTYYERVKKKTKYRFVRK